MGVDSKGGWVGSYVVENDMVVVGVIRGMWIVMDGLGTSSTCRGCSDNEGGYIVDVTWASTARVDELWVIRGRK